MTTDLDKAARALRSARARLDEAMATAEQAALTANAAGVAETEIARKVGVNRMTVRRWLGKL
jgi:DNA invertase Pin-like site-specific DNA recombinase